MKNIFSRIFGLFGGVVLAFALLPAQPAKAEFALIDVAGAWYFYFQRGVGQRNAACQVVNCAGGDCQQSAASRVQFSLYDARDGKGIWPEFIAPSRVPPGGSARLEINGSSYTLRNTLRARTYYLQILNERDARDVLAELRALELSDRNGKFKVRGPEGRSYSFSVRGVNTVLERMLRRCTPRN